MSRCLFHSRLLDPMHISPSHLVFGLSLSFLVVVVFVWLPHLWEIRRSSFNLCNSNDTIYDGTNQQGHETVHSFVGFPSTMFLYHKRGRWLRRHVPVFLAYLNYWHVLQCRQSAVCMMHDVHFCNRSKKYHIIRLSQRMWKRSLWIYFLH